MKAFIDRIEDGKTAVLCIKNAGELHLPVKAFKFKIYEGMHLVLDLKPDAQSELEVLNEVKRLRKKLLKKSRNP